MPILIAMSIAYVAYAAKNKGESEGNENDPNPPPALDPQVLQGKAKVDLLPLERTLSMFEAPIATITFMDGNPTVAAAYLKQQVGKIIYRNPWLGGFLAPDRSDHNAIKLFFDASSDHVQGGAFEALEAGQVALTRDTTYAEYGELLAPHNVLVRHNSELIGKDAPLWRVVVIPDAEYPDSRFALVVSMSHMIGDGHTFFAVQNMLHCKNGDDTSVIVAMNPNRRPADYSRHLVDKVGKDDAYLVSRLSKTPLFARKPDETVIERRAFFLNTNWIEAKKEKWETIRMQALSGDGNVDEGSSASSDFKVSFAAHDRLTDRLTTSDIVTSWFFRKVGASIGLLACNLRHELPGYTKDNAGNFVTHIPFTSRNYASPMLIQQGRKQIRRSHAEQNPLPPHSVDNRYATSTDWRAFQREGGLVLGNGNGNNSEQQEEPQPDNASEADPRQEHVCRQILQLPCYQMKDLNCIPKTFSSIHLFNAGPLGEAACVVIAPVDVLKKMEESGMISQTIGQHMVSEREDGFADAVNDALEGRRQSRYAVILDESLRNIQLE